MRQERIWKGWHLINQLGFDRYPLRLPLHQFFSSKFLRKNVQFFSRDFYKWAVPIICITGTRMNRRKMNLKFVFIDLKFRLWNICYYISLIKSTIQYYHKHVYEYGNYVVSLIIMYKKGFYEKYFFFENIDSTLFKVISIICINIWNCLLFMWIAFQTFFLSKLTKKYHRSCPTGNNRLSIKNVMKL